MKRLESARWLSQLRWWLTRPPLLKGAAALAFVCAMAFALGQGAAALHASTLAAQAKRPMSAPLAAEQVSAAKGVLPSIVSPATAPPTQVAFTAHPAQTLQAPLRHPDKGAKQHGKDHGAENAHESPAQSNTQGSTLGGPHGGPPGGNHGPGHDTEQSGGD